MLDDIKRIQKMCNDCLGKECRTYLRDPWGQPVVFKVHEESLFASSAGPDGEHGNMDDMNRKIMSCSNNPGRLEMPAHD